MATKADEAIRRLSAGDSGLFGDDLIAFLAQYSPSEARFLSAIAASVSGLVSDLRRDVSEGAITLPSDPLDAYELGIRDATAAFTGAILAKRGK